MNLAFSYLIDPYVSFNLHRISLAKPLESIRKLSYIHEVIEKLNKRNLTLAY